MLIVGTLQNLDDANSARPIFWILGHEKTTDGKVSYFPTAKRQYFQQLTSFQVPLDVISKDINQIT